MSARNVKYSRMNLHALCKNQNIWNLPIHGIVFAHSSPRINFRDYSFNCSRYSYHFLNCFNYPRFALSCPQHSHNILSPTSSNSTPQATPPTTTAPSTERLKVIQLTEKNWQRPRVCYLLWAHAPASRQADRCDVTAMTLDSSCKWDRLFRLHHYLSPASRLTVPKATRENSSFSITFCFNEEFCR